MAILDELTEQEVSKNKTIRGYIPRPAQKAVRTPCSSVRSQTPSSLTA